MRRGLTEKRDGFGHHPAVDGAHLDGRHVVDFAAEGRPGDGFAAVRHVDPVLASVAGGELHPEGVVTIVPDLRRHRESIGAYTDAAKLVRPYTTPGTRTREGAE